MSRVLSLRLAPVLLAVALVLGVGQPVARGQDVLNGIAAVVSSGNQPEEVITFSQVRELVASKELAAKQQVTGEALVEKIKEIRMQAINDLIDRQLILQEFKTMGAKIPEYYIDEQVSAEIRGSEFNGDRQAFIRTIEAQGYTLEKFKEFKRDIIIVQEMTKSAVKSNVIIPEAKIAQFYKQNIEEYSTGDEVKLRMISMQKSGTDSRRKMMEEIRTKATEGVDFGKLALMYSQDSTQEQEGDWGWIDRKKLNESLTKAAFSLKPGEISEVIEIGETYYLLYVEARKAATQRPFKEVRDEIEKTLIQRERQKLRQEWLLKLRKKAYVKMF